MIPIDQGEGYTPSNKRVNSIFPELARLGTSVCSGRPRPRRHWRTEDCHFISFEEFKFVCNLAGRSPCW